MFGDSYKDILFFSCLIFSLFLFTDFIHFVVSFILHKIYEDESEEKNDDEMY